MSEEFRGLLDQVATGWNTGDPDLAARAFADDAVYVEPPARQRHVGRQALRDFFHGPDVRPRAMSMTWHAAAFDAARQVGFGEYTFSTAGFQAHGIVCVTVRDGRIVSWREYQYRSEQPYDEFAGDSLTS